jgi:hypothetical protein
MSLKVSEARYRILLERHMYLKSWDLMLKTNYL